MIIDQLKNSDIYAYNEDLKQAFDYLKSLKEFPREEGTVEICGKRIFANIFSYQTKLAAECKMEAHRKFIDIQVSFAGQEIIAWHPTSELEEIVAYDADCDVSFHEIPETTQGKAILSPGNFMIFYPDDAHMPQIAIDETPEQLAKIVIKIAVD